MTNTKPKVKLTGTDGNVFSLVGLVAKALRRAGLADQAEKFTTRAWNSHSYGEVLQLCMEYCDVR